MISRFRAWVRWILKTDWIYIGSGVWRDYGAEYELEEWLNVHTNERRAVVGRLIDPGERLP